MNEFDYRLPYKKLDFEEYEDLRNFDDADSKLSFSGQLRPEQQVMVDEFFSIGDRVRSGLFQAPCGWGKTYVACNLIARAEKKTLIFNNLSFQIFRINYII